MKALRSLQARLLALVLATVLAGWAIAAIVTALDAKEELDELLDAHLAQTASLLAARAAHELHEDHEVEPARLHRYALKVAFRVTHEGRVLLSSANVPAWPQPQREGFRSIEFDGRSWRVFTTHTERGDVQVEVGEMLASRWDIVEAVLRGMLLPMLLLLPLLALALWWAVRRGTRPLREIGQELRARQPAQLSPLAARDVPAEIEPAIDALNDLFARIALLLESERRLTADAAHELRTPIAGIRAQAQVALASSDDAQRRRALDATIAGCDRAARVIEQLLTLSRVESGEQPAMADVDLSRIARDVLAQAAGRAAAKDQEIELDAPTPCVVRGNETLLAVLVRNLVDNALRYGAVRDHVTVRVAMHEGTALLAVEDSGPGLPAEVRERLGERFVRPAGQDESGSGLGWSIVRRIAQVHGGSIDVDTSPMLGGLRVRLRLPEAPPRAGA